MSEKRYSVELSERELRVLVHAASFVDQVLGPFAQECGFSIDDVPAIVSAQMQLEAAMITSGVDL